MIFKFILTTISPPIGALLLIKENRDLRRILTANMTYSAYLADIVNRNEMELSEFDRIVLINEFGATLEEGAE
jgi:hypothetical protein